MVPMRLSTGDFARAWLGECVDDLLPSTMDCCSADSARIRSTTRATTALDRVAGDFNGLLIVIITTHVPLAPGKIVLAAGEMWRTREMWQRG
uniref:Uncharacterized protein n=1 Tax=Oryza nivara TaxID=4536 RepID=A0A0E0JAV3_ORYNI